MNEAHADSVVQPGEGQVDPQGPEPALLTIGAPQMLLLALAGVLTGALVAWRADYPGGPVALAGVVGMCVVIPLLTYIDFKVHRLPNVLVLGAFVSAFAGLVGAVVVGDLSLGSVAVAAGVGLGLAVLLTGLAIVTSGGLGMGDIKWVGVAGMVLAVKSALLAVQALFILAPLLAVCALPFLWLNHQRDPSVPFSKKPFAYGPYLLAATVAALLVPDSWTLWQV